MWKLCLRIGYHPRPVATAQHREAELPKPGSQAEFGNQRKVLPTGCGIPWLGFVVFPDHRRVKRRNVVHATRRLAGRFDAWREGDISFGEFDASVRGWVNHVRYADSSLVPKLRLGTHLVEALLPKRLSSETGRHSPTPGSTASETWFPSGAWEPAEGSPHRLRHSLAGFRGLPGSSPGQAAQRGTCHPATCGTLRCLARRGSQLRRIRRKRPGVGQSCALCR